MLYGMELRVEGNCPDWERVPQARRAARNPPQSCAEKLQRGLGADSDQVAKHSSEKETKVNKQQMKPFAWGAVVGAVGLSILMFSTGWAVTSGVAEADAREMSRAAVIENLAAICVAQFEATANKEENLNKLIATDTWQRGSYVQQQGWAIMPGSDSATSQVAAACAMRLAQLSG